MALPTIILMGFTLHAPLVLQQFNLLPDWTNLNKTLPWIGSSVLGCSTAGAIYLVGWCRNRPTSWKPLQDFFACHDLYTANFTIVFGVGLVSSIIALVDRYLVDGLLTCRLGLGFQWRSLVAPPDKCSLCLHYCLWGRSRMMMGWHFLVSSFAQYFS